MSVKGLGLLLLFAGPTLASMTVPPDSSEVVGMHGEIYVAGTMTESACRLDMSSAWQQIDMGNIATAELQDAGNQGEPVKISFQLRDCVPVGARYRDNRSGSLLWGRESPAMNVRFMAATDSNNPELIALQGVSGIGLRIQDAYGRDTHPGDRGTPMLLNPGQDTLIYTLTPVRTVAPLRGGAWHALINVGLDYE